MSAGEPGGGTWTTPAVLREAVRRHGPQEAIVDGDVRLSYADLGEAVETASRALLADGVEPGDRVAIWAPNTHHWVVAALALHGVGAVLVPLNTRLVGREALDMLQRSKAKALFLPDGFLDRDYLKTLRDAGAGGGPDGGDGPVPGLPDLRTVVLLPVHGGGAPGAARWDEWLASAGRVSARVARERAAAVDPDALCDILFTSGTTGRPKGAMSSHRQTVAVAAAWAERAEVGTADRYLIISPFFHSFGYKAGFLVALLRGATILPQQVFDVDRAMELIARERVTIVPGPPTIYESMLAHAGGTGDRTSSLRLAVTGSAMVPVALIERMRERLGFEAITTAYGLSEAVVVTMCHLDDDPETITRTCGTATAGFEIRITDAEGDPAAPGADGEVQLRGPNVMLGYLDDEEATRRAFTEDGWFRTGDVGHLDGRGHLTITDRLKDMFTVGGFNVYPAEVEQALMRLGAVVACSVVGVPDPRLGEVGHAYLVLQGGARLEADEVIAFCREQLANFKVPRYVEFLAELPRNAAGKVVKGELRDRAAARTTG